MQPHFVQSMPWLVGFAQMIKIQEDLQAVNVSSFFSFSFSFLIKKIMYFVFFLHFEILGLIYFYFSAFFSFLV